MKKDKLEELLNSLLERINKIEDFVLAEAPDIVKDIVKVEHIKVQNNLIGAFIALLIGLVYNSLFIYNYHTIVNYSEGMAFSGAILSVVLFLAMGLGFYGFIESILKYRELKASDKLVAIKGISKILRG